MSDTIASVTGNVLDVEKIRKDFPILSQSVRGKPLIWDACIHALQTPIEHRIL